MADEIQAESDPAKLTTFNIIGNKIALGSLRKDLLPTYTRWMNNLHTLRTMGALPRPLTAEQEERWYERASEDSERKITFTIYERSTANPIGNCGLFGIEYRNRTAELGIMIGEPDARSKGYGTEATGLVLGYAFTALGLHNVMLLVHEYNPAGISAYTKAGFREFGRRRESHYMGGKYWDVIHMECLASEWGPSPVLADVFKPDEPRDSL
jgi:RimJ/RimL family protein N-acetyltransferase